MTTPFDIVNDISHLKKNILKEDPSSIAQYVPFVINKSLSYHADAILWVNEMNQHHHLDFHLQHAFLLNSLRKAKRFAKWVKKSSDEDVATVAEYYGFSLSKASEALELLTDGQLTQIKERLQKGGSDDRKTRGKP